MRRTTLDIMTIFYKRLKGSTAGTEVGGRIYKQARPINSVNEDIVINALPINFDQHQRGVANVNIYVPAQVIGAAGGQDQQPNMPRFQQITNLVMDALDDFWEDGFHSHLQQQALIQDQDTLAWYNNIRFDIFSINLSN